MSLSQLPKESSVSKASTLRATKILCYFYLWENSEEGLYRNNPHTLEALQFEIWNAVLEIMGSELRDFAEFILM
jgi:hypothetical protein